jgi:hypothetical protein
MQAHLRFAAAAALAGAAWSPSMAAGLSVTFVAPDKYVDAAPSGWHGSDKERAQVQRDIEQHLQQLAERHLAPADTLKIEVLDIDLAGRSEPFRLSSGADVRILRGVTWPSMTLRYTLSQGERVVASAEERVSDLNYLRPISRYSGSDRLRYEKTMLDDWFDKRIVERR